MPAVAADGVTVETEFPMVFTKRVQQGRNVIRGQESLAVMQGSFCCLYCVM